MIFLYLKWTTFEKFNAVSLICDIRSLKRQAYSIICIKF